MIKCKNTIFLSVTLIVISLFFSCEKILPKAPAEDSLLDGTLEGLTLEQNAQFLRGDANVNEVFLPSGGLGPTFVSNNCISCHAGDGKGHPTTSLIRFGQIDETGNQFLDQGGPQWQSRAIAGFEPEQIPVGATSTKLLPPAFTGLGFLQHVPDQTLIDLADPTDANGDGISGVPHFTFIPATIAPNPNAVEIDGKYLCRFGKKGSAYNLLHQTIDAFNQDMGITSIFDPIDVYSGLEIDPEVSTQKVNDVVFYLNTLKAPIQRFQNDEETIEGKNIFNAINCNGCHTSTLTTGYSNIAALSYKEFSPYTDLLLHDMGAVLDDGYTEGHAKTYEWKTPALWGLGLSEDSQGGEYFLLHDGRAGSIDEAITMHGGEATNSVQNYQNLSQSEKNALLKFLESL
jgi:CxxC motif-containing protein (DUF1111 family)